MALGRQCGEQFRLLVAARSGGLSIRRIRSGDGRVNIVGVFVAILRRNLVAPPLLSCRRRHRERRVAMLGLNERSAQSLDGALKCGR